MPIIKTEQKTNFAQIPNATCRDQNLDKFSLGVLVHLISLPSNWIIHKSYMQKECGCGKKKMDGVFKDLQKNHYLVKVPFRTQGKFTKDVWIVFADAEEGKKYAENNDLLIELLEDNMPVKVFDTEIGEKIENPYLTRATPDFQPCTPKGATVKKPPCTLLRSTVKEPLQRKSIKRPKRTTTTTTARAKISVDRFIEKVNSAMEGSGIPVWFITEKTIDIHEQYSIPDSAMAIAICVKDWKSMQNKQDSSNEIVFS